jgi:hypothetical protein
MNRLFGGFSIGVALGMIPDNLPPHFHWFCVALFGVLGLIVIIGSAIFDS